MIIGCGGAGKSTLAKKLHRITGIPLIHLDSHFWKPGWIETDKREWATMVDSLSDQEAWIIDGNYGGTMEIRLKKATTILFLDRSRWLCLYRVTKRVLSNYGRTRADMAEGCNERFSWEFMQYVYQYNQTRCPRILDRLDQLSNSKNIQILSSQRAINCYLKEMKQKFYDAD